jgi:predicted branched-subunit amino acid permease/RimJ/RimL family protein N-acetyltransferase
VNTMIEAEHQEAVLTDGDRVVLRPVRPDDRALVETVFSSLSAESRRMRFLVPMPRYSNRLLDFLTDVDGTDHVAWLAMSGDAPVGIARYVRVHDEPTTAEVAVTVVDDHQGRGLGSLLVEAVRAAAGRNGFERLLWNVHPENVAAQGLMRALGMSWGYRDGTLVGYLPVDAASPTYAAPGGSPDVTGPPAPTPDVVARLPRAGLSAVADILPVIASTAPFGMLVGVSTGALPIDPVAALTGSLLVYGGSAQLAATTLLDAGAGVATVLLAVLVVQARLLLYGAALEPAFREQPALFRWLAPVTIVDQTYAVATSRGSELADPARFRRYWLTAGLLLGLGWLAAVGVGIALGPVLPVDSPLSIAIPATFTSLLVPRLVNRPAVAGAATAALVTALASPLPHGLGLLLGVAAGVTAASLTPRRKS